MIGNINNKLYTKLNSAIQEYVNIFEKKHEIIFDFWVSDDVGTIACFSNTYYISFDDIRYDLERGVDSQLFFEWYDLALELHSNKEQNINYSSYVMGYRPNK